MKLVSIDVESCGLAGEHDILEFGAVLDDLNNPLALEDLPIFHCYFLQESYHGSPFALSMHPTIFRRIADREPGYTYVNPMKFGHMFKKFLIQNGYEEEQQLIRINAAGKCFGTSDLPALWAKTDIAKHVRIRKKVLDPGILYLERGDESLPGLSECKKRAGLDETVAHNAVDDAMDVVRLLRKKLLFDIGAPFFQVTMEAIVKADMERT